MTARASHALIRFGLGGRHDPAMEPPESWLAGQLNGPDPAAADPATGTMAEGAALLVTTRDPAAEEARRARVREMTQSSNAAATETLLTTNTPFRERLVWFWANHFTISRRRISVAHMAHAYVREAIRPHVTGRFANMLHAVMRSPAMLVYLDNMYSVGPNSPAGKRQRRGLNENLARECLELHTVTQAAGYTQADVTELARVLTGWSVSFTDPAGFRWRPETHEPGEKKFMGHPFPEGEAGITAALDFLATHPATHRNLAVKLVRHFVADDPPEPAIRRIEAVLRDTKGDLKAASLALLQLPEAWTPLTKLRAPFDYVIGVLRALDLPAPRRPDVPGVLSGLGQGYLNAPLPNGWPDTAADWASPESMIRRVDWAYAVAGRAGNLDPAELARASLGPLLPEPTLQQIARAGSRREGMTMLLAAPEFLRR